MIRPHHWRQWSQPAFLSPLPFLPPPSAPTERKECSAAANMLQTCCDSRGTETRSSALSSSPPYLSLYSAFTSGGRRAASARSPTCSRGRRQRGRLLEALQLPFLPDAPGAAAVRWRWLQQGRKHSRDQAPLLPSLYPLWHRSGGQKLCCRCPRPILPQPCPCSSTCASPSPPSCATAAAAFFCFLAGRPASGAAPSLADGASPGRKTGNARERKRLAGTRHIQACRRRVGIRHGERAPCFPCEDGTKASQAGQAAPQKSMLSAPLSAHSSPLHPAPPAPPRRPCALLPPPSPPGLSAARSASLLLRFFFSFFFFFLSPPLTVLGAGESSLPAAARGRGQASD